MNVSQLAGHFKSLFGSQPAIFRAPGRVNLIGEHTDYNEGFVMPAAVAFSTYVAIAPRTDRKLIIRSEELSGDYEFDLDNLPRQRIDSWCDYVLGVASVLAQRGYRLRGSNLLVHGEVPIGAGLSSSAAIEVASAFALMSLADIDLALSDIAKLCRQAENTFVGAKVGIMDQFISCMGKAGHAILLDCRSLEVKFVPIPTNLRLVVCNTMVKHSLATGAYNTRREECEEGVHLFEKWDPTVRALRDVSAQLLTDHAQDLPATIRKRCSHVVGENERVLETTSVLTEGNLDRLRELMRESHVSLRDLYEVSCHELDIMVDAAQDLPGFCGGRMTGGGFGGCTINLVKEEHAEDFSIQITERYRRATGIGAQVYLCTAEAGAERIS